MPHRAELTVRIRGLDSLRDRTSLQILKPDAFVERSCPQCGAAGGARLGLFDLIPVIRCGSCGQRYAGLMLSGRYPLDVDPRHRQYRPREDLVTAAEAEVSRRVILKELAGTVDATAALSFLDFGAGLGCFSAAAQRLGWSADVVEINPDLRRMLSEGLGVTAVETVEALPADRLYDVVWLNYVVCQLPDPLSILRALAARTKPGGVICVGEINYNSYCVRNNGLSHYYWAPPQLNFFDRDSLARMLQAAGYGAPKIVRESKIHPYVFLDGRDETLEYLHADTLRPAPQPHWKIALKRAAASTPAVTAFSALRRVLSAAGMRRLETSDLGNQITVVAGK